MMTNLDFCYIENELEGTEEDYKGNKNIVPQGTSCSLNRNHPCSDLISTEKWENCSKGESIEEQLVLINTSICKCTRGGIITITDSKCSIVYSN